MTIADAISHANPTLAAVVAVATVVGLMLYLLISGDRGHDSRADAAAALHRQANELRDLDDPDARPR